MVATVARPRRWRGRSVTTGPLSACADPSRSTPRISLMRRPLPGVDHTYRRRLPVCRGRRGRDVRLRRRRARRTCIWRAAPAPRRCTGTGANSAAPCVSSGWPSLLTDAGRRQWRLPDRCRRRPAHRPGRAASWRGRHPPRPRRLPLRARQRDARASMTATRLDGRRSARPGRCRQHRFRPWPSVTIWCSTTRANGPVACADDRLVRPAASGDRYARAHRAAAELVHAIDALQRLGPVGSAGPARFE